MSTPMEGDVGDRETFTPDGSVTSTLRAPPSASDASATSAPRADHTQIRKIVFLGTNSAVPSPGKRNTSAIAVVLSNSNCVLLDCGEATQHQIMRSQSVKMRGIDAILLTHLHGDHCFGSAHPCHMCPQRSVHFARSIFGLLCTMATQGRTKAVVIAGPKGVKEMVDTVLRCAGGFGAYPLEFMELENKEELYLGELSEGLRVTACPLKHRVPTFGFALEELTRAGSLDAKKAASFGAKGKQLGQLKNGEDVKLDDGRVIRSADVLGDPIPGKRVVLLQDTCDSSAALKMSANCDLLIHEATYHHELAAKSIAHGHSTARMAGEYAEQVGAKLLVLTHFSSRYSAAGTAAPTATASANVEAKTGSPARKSKSDVADAKSAAEPTAAAAALEAKGAVADVTIADLVAEASAACPKVMKDGGVIAAEDFLVIEQSKNAFRAAGSDLPPQPVATPTTSALASDASTTTAPAAAKAASAAQKKGDKGKQAPAAESANS